MVEEEVVVVVEGKKRGVHRLRERSGGVGGTRLPLGLIVAIPLPRAFAPQRLGGGWTLLHPLTHSALPLLHF